MHRWLWLTALILLGGAALAANSGPFNPVSIGPSGALQGAGLAPVAAIGATSDVLLAQPGNVYGAYAVNRTATPGFLVLYNAIAAPSTGALTTNLILGCAPLPASGFASIAYMPGPPAAFSIGAVALVTSAATCATYTTGVITADIFGGAL